MTVEPGRYDDLDPQVAGERIGDLYDELARRLPADAWIQLSELTRLLTAVHGAALERMLDIAASTPDGERLVASFTDDPLVKSVLIVHDLVPDDTPDVEPPRPAVAQPVTLLPRRPRP